MGLTRLAHIAFKILKAIGSEIEFLRSFNEQALPKEKKDAVPTPTPDLSESEVLTPQSV